MEATMEIDTTSRPRWNPDELELLMAELLDTYRNHMLIRLIERASVQAHKSGEWIDSNLRDRLLKLKRAGNGEAYMVLRALYDPLRDIPKMMNNKVCVPIIRWRGRVAR
jgi:hypothetical protein